MSVNTDGEEGGPTTQLTTPGGPPPKTGTVASAEQQINAHFKAKGGIKVGDTGTSGISYNDTKILDGLFSPFMLQFHNLYTATTTGVN